MSEENQRECFGSLNRMLNRTQNNKSITTPGVVWQYKDIVSVFMRGIKISLPRASEIPTAMGNTPAIQTPNSEHGSNNQSCYTPNSIVGDMSRMSVRLAMDDQTRNVIDRELNRENSLLQQHIPYSQIPQWNNGDNQYYENQAVTPNFRIQTNNTFQGNHHSYNLVQPNQHTESFRNGAYAGNGPLQQKRPRSPERAEHYHSSAQHNNNGNSQINDNRYENRNHDRRDDSSDRSSSSSDTDDSDMEEEEAGILIDPYDHQPWIIYNRRIHEKLSDNRMTLPSSSGQRVTAEVIYNPSNPNLFRTKGISDTSRLTPFLGATEAHNMIMRAFDLRASDSVSPNKVLRIVDSKITPNSGLSQLLELIKSHEPSMTKTARDKSEKQIMHTFPDAAFDSISVVNLNIGWPFQGNDYMEWAKDRTLSIEDFKDQIRFDAFDTSSCTPEILNKEKETRKLLVNQFTTIHLIELLGTKINKLDDSVKAKHRISSEECKAIAQTMLPTKKHLMAQWMKAKMEVRNSLLSKNSWLGAVSWILKSSLWDSSIFPKSAIEQMRHEATNDVAEKLGLTKPFGYRNSQQPPFKKSKNFHTQNQQGAFQIQRTKNNPGQNSQQQKFQQQNQQQNFQQQNFRGGGRQKKGKQHKTKKWVKTNQYNKKFKGFKTKQDFNKKQAKNGNNYNNNKQEK